MCQSFGVLSLYKRIDQKYKGPIARSYSMTFTRLFIPILLAGVCQLRADWIDCGSSNDVIDLVSVQFKEITWVKEDAKTDCGIKFKLPAKHNFQIALREFRVAGDFSKGQFNKCPIYIPSQFFFFW